MGDTSFKIAVEGVLWREGGRERGKGGKRMKEGREGSTKGRKEGRTE